MAFFTGPDHERVAPRHGSRFKNIRKLDMNDLTPDFTKRRDRLRWEIFLALTLKLALLSVLWLAFFRHDPNAPRPAVADLFSSNRTLLDCQERLE